MKKFLYTLLFVFSLHAASAQDEGNPDKVRARMTEYIQKRLSLNDAEAKSFAPVFINYFNELRQTNQSFKGDRLVLQQKVVDLRLRYRDQFKGIIGEKRSNDVFTYEREFIQEVKELRQERMDKSPDDRKRKDG